MTKRLVCFLGIYCLFCTMLRAQEVGNYGFLELPVSARTGALGGINISVVEPDLALADQNPALLCPEMRGQLSVSYTNYVADINLGHISYAGALSEAGTWSAGVRYVDYGTFDRYDESGMAMGTFSAKDMAFCGSVAFPINDRWRCGATARLLYSAYDSYSAFAVGVDLGLNYYNEASGRSVSMTLSNLGGQLKPFEDRHASLPTQLTLGVTKELEHLPFCLSLTAWQLLAWDTDCVAAGGTTRNYSNSEQILNHLVFGLEWLPSEHLYFAAAYNYRRQRQFAGMGGFLRGVSFGGGFRHARFSLQCSYARYNAADGSLTVGCGYQF